MCMGVWIDIIRMWINKLFALQACHIRLKQRECDYFIALYYFLAC